MKPIHILLFLLTVGIFYTLVQKYKPNSFAQVEKSKEVIQQIIDKIPKKMQKVIVESKDIFPAGLIKLASVVSNVRSGNKSKEDKILETFEDIKDIRYGKIGGSNIKDGISENKWIKVSSFTLSGAWTEKGLTLEVYPRSRLITSSRQTLVAVVRNIDSDVEAPYISLNTHNENDPNTRLIKDVKVIRVSGSGTSDNKIEVWIQFAHNWANTAYVMYFLYNFKPKDFIATVPQAMTDSPSGGQSWGISERIEPLNGKNTVNVGKGNGWGTALNINAPQQPESLYSLHFGDGSAIHERQAGMGYIKDQPNRIWGATRGTLATHIHQDDDLHIYSSGWNPLFSIKGGSGDAYHRGKVNVGGTLTAMGGANVEGKVGFRHAGANGDDSTDVYNLEKVTTSYNNNSLRMTINDDADESFQIWGNSCNEAGGCGAQGALKHHFQATGRTQHLTYDGDANSEQLIIGTTDRSNLRLGKTAEYSWIQSHGSKPLKINPIGNEVHIANTGVKTIMNGDVEIKGKLTIGNSVLTSEGASLIVGHADGRRIMRIDPDWDKIQIYRDSNGATPYLYYNMHNGFGIWG